MLHEEGPRQRSMLNRYRPEGVARTTCVPIAIPTHMTPAEGSDLDNDCTTTWPESFLKSSCSCNTESIPQGYGMRY